MTLNSFKKQTENNNFEVVKINKMLANATLRMGFVYLDGIRIKIHLIHDWLEKEAVLAPDHTHETYELSLISKGAMKYCFGEDSCELHEGDICFIPPRLLHSRIAVVTPVIISGFMLDIESVKTEFNDLLDNTPKTLKSLGYHFRNCHDLLRISSLWRDSAEMQKPFSIELMQLFLQQFLFKFFQFFWGNKLDDIVQSGKRDIFAKEQFIWKTRHFIEENIGNSIGISEVADFFNYSTRHFSRIFKNASLQNFSDFVLQIKINAAKKDLLNGTKLIKNIAKDLGFSDSAHFCRVFKKMTGKTPSEYAGRCHNS